MRPTQILLGVAMVAAATALIAMGSGRFAAPTDSAVTIDNPDMSDLPDESASQASQANEGTQAELSPVQQEQPEAQAQDALSAPLSPSYDPARTIDPETIAPPDVAARELERVAPRKPLSTLSLAQPPKPKPPEELKNEPLYQPVAVAAGLIEAKGNTIALSGVEAVKPDETCSDAAGKSWNCGMRARTAFRAFLRGRAVTCSGARTTKDAAASGTDAPTATVADCKVARQDVGQWLVENGWARAAQGGAYADAGEVARKAGKGIFGAAPDLSGLPPPPAAVEDTAPEAPSSILDLSGTAATPPDDPSMQQQVFPPAPAQ